MIAYTSLEQSKKLAEILPLESADMFCLVVGDTPRVHVLTEPLNNYSHWENYPCWSLAALLEIIPKEIFSGEYIINITEGLDNKWCITYDNIDNRNHSFYGLSSSVDNLIDACYEMILKLHGLKML